MQKYDEIFTLQNIICKKFLFAEILNRIIDYKLLFICSFSTIFAKQTIL